MRSEYDFEYEYTDYLNWEKPADYDAMLEYLEDCNEDGNQEDCELDCEMDPTAYAWCESLANCQTEINCCKADCGDEDEDYLCHEDCDYYGGICKANGTSTWTGETSNLSCKAYYCDGYHYNDVYDCSPLYDEADPSEYNTCVDTALEDYYTCLGPITCNERYVDICQGRCVEAGYEEGSDCYGDCATDLTFCDCMEDHAEC